MTEPPEAFKARGAALWADLDAGRDLTGGGLALAVEACRIADRLDGLDGVIRGRGVLELMHFRSLADRGDDTRHVELKVDGVFAEARQQANVLRQIVAGLPMKGDDDSDSDGDEFLNGLSA